MDLAEGESAGFMLDLLLKEDSVSESNESFLYLIGVFSALFLFGILFLVLFNFYSDGDLETFDIDLLI